MKRESTALHKVHVEVVEAVVDLVVFYARLDAGHSL